MESESKLSDGPPFARSGGWATLKAALDSGELHWHRDILRPLFEAGLRENGRLCLERRKRDRAMSPNGGDEPPRKRE